MEIIINAKFRDLLDLPSDAERAELERQLIENKGPREPILIRKETGEIVDGHNRYAICKANDLPFKTVEKSFATDEAVEEWILANQLARRNLSPARVTYFIGKLYNMRKQDPAQARTATEDGISTAEKIATQFGVNEKTVRRAGDVVKGLEVVSDELQLTSIKDKLAAMAGKTDLAFNKQELETIGKVDDPAIAKEAVKIMVEEKKQAAAARTAAKAAGKPAPKVEKPKTYPVVFMKPDFDLIGFSVATAERPPLPDNGIVYMCVPDEELTKGLDLFKRFGLSFEGTFVFKIDGYEGNWTDVRHAFLLIGVKGVMTGPAKGSPSIQEAKGAPEIDMIKLIEKYHPKAEKLDMRKKNTAPGWASK